MPTTAEIAQMLALLIFYGIAIAYGEQATYFANYAGPVILSLIVGAAIYHMVITNRHTLWAPLLWYRIAVVGYFGVGSLVTLLLNEETRAMIASFFDFFPRDVLKFNIAVALFHTSVLAFTFGIIGPLRSRGNNADILSFISRSNMSGEAIGFIFLAIGTAANYLLIYPTAVEIFKVELPNIVIQIGQLAYIGYFLVGYWALKNDRRRWFWFIFALTVIDSIAGIVQLSKYASLFPALMLPVAYLYNKISFKRIMLIVSIFVPYYFVVADIVTEGRRLVERTEENRAVLSDTIRVLSARATGADQSQADAPEYQIGWARLSYVNAGAFAISQYDQGLPGDSLRDVFVVWIPRIFYPDKPIITDIGRDFTFRANGNYNSSTSPSIPAEGYWTFGWLGVVMFAAVVATVLTFWSIYSVAAVMREAWHLLLVVALGMRLGGRIDGMLVIDVIGPISAAVVLHLICHFANRLLPARTEA
ncbi:hypothetical protein [Sphingomonas sp.]|uniref:hypothetical protein n=1 Tax=Sphingomonas sp. TaxID=28214 RepID=UPI00184EA02C|nr:hypothetical protein [Sphingomonas sp.]MBA4762014.1 hypothetical protein [Sphingomonas sp.]